MFGALVGSLNHSHCFTCGWKLALINIQLHIYIPALAAAGRGSNVRGQYIQAVVLGQV